MCCPLNLNTSAKLNSDITLEKTLVVKERTFALFSFSVLLLLLLFFVGYLLGAKIIDLVSVLGYHHFRVFFVFFFVRYIS